MKNIQKEIITHLKSREEFMNLLQNNPGLILIKFKASWCNPCKKIQTIMDAFFASSPDNVLCCDIDINECNDLYSFLKAKKMLNGVPTTLVYSKGNTSFIPDDSVVGIEASELNYFFKRCGKMLHSIVK